MHHFGDDPFLGPFDLKPMSPRLQRARESRLQALGRWAAGHRWYAKGLLVPAPGRPGVSVTTLGSRALETPLLCARLDRTLGEVVREGPQDEVAIRQRIDDAVAYWLELSLAAEAGVIVCRGIRITPAGDDGDLAWLPPLSQIRDLTRHLFGYAAESVVSSPQRRARDADAKSAAEVYLAALAARGRYGAERAIADALGWRTPSTGWRFDDTARARVRRALQRADDLGYLPRQPKPGGIAAWAAATKAWEDAHP